MLYRRIAQTDLHVSAVGLGTWAMGNDFWGFVDDGESITAIQAAIDQGVNLIDTAPAYGAGHAEEIVGRALKGRKDDAIVATKVGVKRTPNDFIVDLSPDSIRTEIDESRRRLNLDIIDLYQIHWPDPHTPIEASIETLAELKLKGAFRYLGVSNFTMEQLQKARTITDIVSVQPHYSLLQRDIERDLVPFCLDHNLGLMAYGTLAGGILTGKYRDIPHFEQTDHRSQFYDFFHEPLWSGIQRFLDALRPIAASYRKPLSQIAINWIMYQPAVTSVLVGAKTADQAISNAEAGNWELSNDDLDLIDEACERYLNPVHEIFPATHASS